MVPHKILFPIETASRELQYKLFLSCKFAEAGHECFIGSKREIYALFPRLSPFVYFDKGYHPGTSEKLYEDIRKHKGLIVNLDEEGGVDFKHSKTISSRYPEKLFSICDLIFLWGQAQHRLLKKKRDNFNKDKVIVSGHPRFELLKPEYHLLYQNDVAKIKKKFNEYILINTNMGFGNNIRGDVFVRNNYGSRIPNINEVIEFDRKKQQQIIRVVKKLSSKNYTIVVRPHPEEDLSLYKAAFKNLSNVFVIYKGSVVPWLIGATIMIHPDCTTGIESLMIGKRSISILPDENDMLNTYAAVKVSHSFFNEDEAIDFIKEKGFLSDNQTIKNSILQDYFSFNSKTTDDIVENVKGLTQQNICPTKNLNNYLYTIKRTTRNYLTFAKGKILKRRSYALAEKKMEGFDVSNVNLIFEQIEKTFFHEKELSLKCYCPHLYKISNRK